MRAQSTRTVDFAGVQELLQREAQLVEVLPAEEYEELHLPGAISVPLKQLDAEHARVLDRARPVIVYCWDALCDMSPRAAARLELLGFDAYDYALSKVDWMAHGEPTEGTAAGASTALSLVRRDVATCGLADSSEAIGALVDASQYAFALVVSEGVVLGRVRRSSLHDAPSTATAESLMEPGPSTTRPHTGLDDLAARFARSGAKTAILTSPEGRLIGVVRRSDLPQG